MRSTSPLENVFNRIAKSEYQPPLIARDVNSPTAELADGTVVPMGLGREEFIPNRWIGAELDVFTGLGAFGMVAVFRSYHGYGILDVADVSFETRRFDHRFGAQPVDQGDCRYEPAGYECSDHAPLVAAFGS